MSLKLGDIVVSDEITARYGFVSKIEAEEVRPVRINFFEGGSTYVNLDGGSVTFRVDICKSDAVFKELVLNKLPERVCEWDEEDRAQYRA